jgi:chitinase
MQQFIGHGRGRRSPLAALLALLGALALFAPAAAAPPARVAPHSEGDSRKIVGYFTNWGIYDPQHPYFAKNIITSGSARRLTHINYAFGNVVGNRCDLTDPWADIDRPASAEESVDGVADTWDDPLRGNFKQLLKLKQQYPKLRVLISLGGWTLSSGFSNAALPENRKAFVQSCVDLFIKNPRWAGLFDGIDIDWEYPGVCGNTCGPEVARPEDTKNFTALLKEFRKQLDKVNHHLLLTIAASAGQEEIDKIEVRKIQRELDWINIMAYDFHGTWESDTNFQSALYSSRGDPARDQHFTAHEAVQLWRDGGAPAKKLVLGVPFYGHGWQGVPDVNHGLYQPSTGAAPGTAEEGTESYRILKTKGYPRYFQHAARAAWLYQGGVFWTYDDPQVMAYKMGYIRSQNLAGVMFWELSNDTDDGELIRALYKNR